MIKRLWHLLFDERLWEWRTARAANFWCSWYPYIGGRFDINLCITPPHTADPDDPKDVSWGPEFRCGFSLLWFDVGLTIPNDNHPDDGWELPAPSKCGTCGTWSVEYRWIDLCVGCDQIEDKCQCIRVSWEGTDVDV